MNHEPARPTTTARTRGPDASTTRTPTHDSTPTMTDTPDPDDEPTKAELEQRVSQLEALTEQLLDALSANRREVLSGAASGLAAFAVGRSLSGPAAADNDQAGTFGTEASPQDGHVEDLFIQDQAAGDAATPPSGYYTLTVENGELRKKDPSGTAAGIAADQIDGYDVEKDGTDGTGTINFKTA